MELRILTLCRWLISDVISLQPLGCAMRLMVPSCLEASSKVVRTECFYRHRRGSSKLTPVSDNKANKIKLGGTSSARCATALYKSPALSRYGGRAHAALLS